MGKHSASIRQALLEYCRLIMVTRLCEMLGVSVGSLNEALLAWKLKCLVMGYVISASS
jgi:hypothetical protein